MNTQSFVSVEWILSLPVFNREWVSGPGDSGVCGCEYRITMPFVPFIGMTFHIPAPKDLDYLDVIIKKIHFTFGDDYPLEDDPHFFCVCEFEDQETITADELDQLIAFQESIHTDRQSQSRLIK